MRFDGASVIGLTIMPLSERFTRSTSEACSSIDRFLWMTPRPPCWAMAIARLDSVTVSIAALTSGTFNRTLRVRRVETSTCVGSTVECCGTRSTSSNVRAVASSVPVGRRVSEPVFNSIQSSESVVRSVRIVRSVPVARRNDERERFERSERFERPERSGYAAAPWHFLYFLPLPHGHGSLRPTFGSSRRTVLITSSPPVRAACGLWLSPPYDACLAEADEAERAAPAKAGIADSAAALFIVMGVAR